MKTKLVSSLVVLLLISSFCLYRLDHLNSIPTIPSNFSWTNKAEIYVLGLAIGVIGYPIYPEVAREHLMMYRPFSNKPKIIESDFFRGSPVVEKAILKLAAHVNPIGWLGLQALTNSPFSQVNIKRHG